MKKYWICKIFTHRFCGSFPKNRQKENSANWWWQKGSDILNVDKKLRVLRFPELKQKYKINYSLNLNPPFFHLYNNLIELTIYSLIKILISVRSTYCIIGTHNIEIPIKNTTNNRPTIIFSTSIFCGSITAHFFFLIFCQISIVKIVEAELNIDVREDIRAASITASIKPFNPEIKQKR